MIATVCSLPLVLRCCMISDLLSYYLTFPMRRGPYEQDNAGCHWRQLPDYR